jgi:hypothetical protein
VQTSAEAKITDVAPFQQFVGAVLASAGACAMWGFSSGVMVFGGILVLDGILAKLSKTWRRQSDRD